MAQIRDPGNFRGLTKLNETHQSAIHRDSRSIVTKLVHQLHSPMVMVGVITLLGGIAYQAPAISDLMVAAASSFAWWGLTRQEDMPLKMPFQSKMLDTKTNRTGEGIFYFGNERGSGKEIWISNSDCRQHMLVLGTTGAGKTEALLGFVANALTWSSGFLFVDGKGDVQLFAKVYALARQFGREDDLLVINFMTGNADVGASGSKLRSNTINPFSTGSSDSLTQMVITLMDDAGGDGAMWKGRATAMFTGVMKALVWLRDNHMADLNVGQIRDMIDFRRIIDLSDPKKYPDLPPKIRKSVQSYTTSLPGFVEEKGYKQAQTTLDQHGYLQMQFTKILGSLADVYGHIFFTQAGEVDMHDVILQRRILVVMLPALEKAPDEIANLGKIIVATLKGMMGATLGAEIEGTWTDVVEKRMTNSPSPFLVCLDEVGYYTVDGMALMTAQARSLGFSMILASQDIPAMKKLNEKEALSIIANTNTKIFMRTEEAEQTIALAINSAGKGTTTRVSGFSATSGEMSTNYRDNMDASLQDVDRINARDIRSQSEGQMTIIQQDNLIRAKSFYANPEGSLNTKKLYLSTNHFIRVPIPLQSEMEAAEQIPKILEVLMDRSFAERMVEEERQNAVRLAAEPEGDEFSMAITAFENYRKENNRANVMTSSCASVAYVIRSFGALPASFARQVAQVQGMHLPAGLGGLSEDDMPGNAAINPRARLQQIHPIEEPDMDDDEDGIMPHFPLQRAPQHPPFNPMGQQSHQPPRHEANQPPNRVDDRRKANIHEVDHGISIDHQPVQDVARNVRSNDAVMRLLADLDYTPKEITREELDDRIQEDMGAFADFANEEVADAETIDNLASESEIIREMHSQPSTAKPQFLSELLDTLIDGTDDD